MLGSMRTHTSTLPLTPNDLCVNVAFGDGLSCAGSSPNPIHFTGQQLDPDGLTHFQFRDLSTIQGRWIVPDPAGVGAANPANPQSWNRYAYVNNSPMTFIDPTGLLDNPIMCPMPIGGECGGGGIDAGSSTDWGSEGPWGDGGSNVGHGAGVEACGVDPFCIKKGGIGPFGSPVANGYSWLNGVITPTGLMVYVWHAPTSVSDANGNISLTIGGWGWDRVSGIQFIQTGPTTWTFTSRDPFQLTVQNFKKAGFVENPEDYLDHFHPKQLDLRDKRHFCSAHVDVNESSGQDGQPTTGDIHIDTVNPWAPSPFPWFVPHLILDVTQIYPGASACQ